MITEWWNSLSSVNQVFYALAAFFSVIFVWQFISSLIGLAGGGGDLDAHGHLDGDADFHGDLHGDVHADADADLGADVHGDFDAGHGVDVDHIEAHSVHDAAETTVAFRLLSARAILAFFTLFTWAASLYLDTGTQLSRSLVLAIVWGVAAWLVVALLMYWLRRLAETGTMRLSTCVGQYGTVYLDIPADGQGQVRVAVSGVVSMVRARAAGRETIRAGTPVQVVRMLDGSSVEVQPVGSAAPQAGPEA